MRDDNRKMPIPGVWRGNSFYAGEKFSSYSLRSNRKNEKRLPEGMVWCEKHRDTYYDPRRFKECFKCYQSKNNL